MREGRTGACGSTRPTPKIRLHPRVVRPRLFPGLHPDGYEDAESGWPRVLKRFAAEAWRRNDAGELLDGEMYPSDAAWAGLCDQMHTHTADETAFRFQIAADYGENRIRMGLP